MFRLQCNKSPMKEPMKNHLVRGELAPTGVSISSRFGALPFQVLLCLLLIFACSLRAQTPVYVGVDDGLLKSTDAGATWNTVNVPLNTPFLKGYVTPEFLAMDPQNASKIYFIGFAAGARRSSPAPMQAPPGLSRPLSACNPPIWLWTSRAR